MPDIEASDLFRELWLRLVPNELGFGSCWQEARPGSGVNSGFCITLFAVCLQGCRAEATIRAARVKLLLHLLRKTPGERMQEIKTHTFLSTWASSTDLF